MGDIFGLTMTQKGSCSRELRLALGEGEPLSFSRDIIVLMRDTGIKKFYRNGWMGRTTLGTPDRPEVQLLTVAGVITFRNQSKMDSCTCPRKPSGYRATCMN
jgi:hypothetical protein